MAARSAGLAILRTTSTGPEILLVHPGGPYWSKKDAGAWSIPKGLVEPGEDELVAAIRETREELGVTVSGEFVSVGESRQPGGKRVVAWAVEAHEPIDASSIVSNTFTLEWPPKSGKFVEFPEVDRAGWFDGLAAAEKVLKGQLPIVRAALATVTAR